MQPSIGPTPPHGRHAAKDNKGNTWIRPNESTIVHCFHWKRKEEKPARLTPSLKEALKSNHEN